MDEGGVSPSSSTDRIPQSFTEVFDAQFPYYLALGMTYDLFWRDDPEIVKYYRKYADIKRDQANHDAWWFGLYTYAAIVRASGAFNFFAKERHPDDYIDKPLDLNQEQKTEEEKKAEAEEKINKGLQAFLAMASRANKNLKRGDTDA